MSELKVGISLEKAIHKAMAKIAKDAMEKHGVCIQEVHFDWLWVSMTTKPTHTLNNTRIVSSVSGNQL